MQIRDAFWIVPVALLLTSCGGSGVGAHSSGVTTAPGTSVTVYNFPGGKGGRLITPSFDAVEGDLFQVSGSSNILVTALGYEVDRTSQQSAPVAMFDSSGKVLATATVSSADTFSNGYYWQSISPVTLYAGEEYYVGAFHGTGSSWHYRWDTEVATTPSSIKDLGTYFKVTSTVGGGSWQFGGGTSQYEPGEIRHYMANFQAQAVP